MMKQRISDVEPIGSSGVTFRTRKEIKEYVEFPLTSACEELYDKNIRTTHSTANRTDIEEGCAGFTIDYDSLSEENKRMAEQLGGQLGTLYKLSYEKDKAYVTFCIPIITDSTDDEVRQKAEEIAHHFRKQAMTWCPRYSLQELKKMYGYPDAGIEDFKKDYYYDSETRMFFESEEHYWKFNEFPAPIVRVER